MRLKNKVVVVTGGFGLLGRSFCDAILRNGAICVITDIKFDKKQFNVYKKKYDAGVIFHKIDISDKNSIKNCISEVVKEFDKIDALINNAYPRNKNYGNHFFDVTYDDFCENINMNLGGYFLTSQLFNKFFINQGYGNIINIASIYGVVPPQFEIYEGTKMTTPVEYAVIKSALIHLTKYIAKYNKGNNIRVNSISLGGINDSQPESFIRNYKNFCLNKGMLDPVDILGTLIFLLSSDSEYVNGQNLIVDDGFTI